MTLSVQDSNQVSANMDKINFWSIVHMTLILIVGLIQVQMYRQYQVSANMDKINFWSIVHMTLILIVGLIQVQMYRQ